MPNIRQEAIKRLLINSGVGASGVAAAIASGLSPEEAAAMSPIEYWKAIKPIYKDLSRRDQAEIAQSILNLPKKDVDLVKSVNHDLPEWFTGKEAKNTSGMLVPRLDYDSFGKLKTVGADVYLRKEKIQNVINSPFSSQREKAHVKQTPAHEVGHLTFERSGIEPRITPWDEIPSEYSTTNMSNTRELFSELLSPASPNRLDLYPYLKNALTNFRLRMGGRNFKITSRQAAIAASLGLAGSTYDEEAEASPLGKLLKAGSKEAIMATKTGQSSTAQALIGKSIQGRVIKNITAGNGKWRNIIFDDGEVLPVTSDYLHDLMREQGKATYAAKTLTQSPEENYNQAVRGLQSAWYRTGQNKKWMSRDYEAKHLNRMNELKPQGIPQAEMAGVYFDNEYHYILKKYAELLNGKQVTLPDRPHVSGVVRMDTNPLLRGK